MSIFRPIRAAIAVALIGTGVLVVPASHASAEPTTVTIDTLNPKLERAEDDKRSTSVTLTVLENAPLYVEAVSGDAGCNLSTIPEKLEARVSTSVTITFPAGGCKYEDDVATFDLRVTDRGNPERIQIFNVTTQKLTPKVDWGPLWYFVGAFAAIFVGFLVIFWIFMRRTNTLKKLRGDKRPAVWGQELPHLEAAYSFKESVVTNVTVLAGILTAVLGTKDIIGAITSDAGGAVALITVGGAISVGLAGASPVIVQLFQNMNSKVTEAGLFLATIVTMTAACGQIIVIGAGAERLGIADSYVFATVRLWHIICVILVAVVVSYGLLNLYRTEVKGLTSPQTKAEVLVAALDDYLKSVTDDSIEDSLESARKSVLAGGASTGGSSKTTEGITAAVA